MDSVIGGASDLKPVRVPDLEQLAVRLLHGLSPGSGLKLKKAIVLLDLVHHGFGDWRGFTPMPIRLVRSGITRDQGPSVRALAPAINQLRCLATALDRTRDQLRPIGQAAKARASQ